MVLDDRLVRKLRGAFFEQGSGPLVYASLVQNPTQGVRDAWVVGGRLLGALGKLKRLFLIAAVLRVESGQIVRRGRETRIERQRLLVSLLSFRDVSLGFVDEA